MAIATVHVPPGSYSGSVSDDIPLALPTLTDSFFYTGDVQTPTWNNYDPLQIEISGDVSATNAGTYTATFTPIGKCVWAINGSQNPYTITWTIEKATPNFAATIDSNVVYNSTGTISISNPDNLAFTATSANSNSVSVQSSSNSAVVVKCENYSAAPVNINFAIPATDNFNGAVYACPVTTEKAEGSLAFSDWGSTYDSHTQNPVRTVTVFDTATFTVSENTSGGELSVSTKATSYINTSISGNVVTVEGLNYTSSYVYATVTAAETDNYKAASKSIFVSIYQATGTATLSENSGTVAVGETRTFTVENTNFGEIKNVTTSGIPSAYFSYITTSINGNAISITCNAYKSGSSSLRFSVNPVDTNYSHVNLSYTFTLAKATPTLELSTDSCTLDAETDTVQITVTTNSDSAISATPVDSSICAASVDDNVVTISSQGVGSTTVIIAVAESDNYLAASATVVVNVTALCPKNLLANMTLADLKQTFASGAAEQNFKVGDYFDITMANTVTLDSSSTIAAGSTWRAVLIGIDHNASLEGSGRGHFAICKTTDNQNIYFAPQSYHSSTEPIGWEESYIRPWLNETFYNALPTDLQNVIADSVKWTDNVDSRATEADVTATTDKIWLPAEFEIFGELTADEALGTIQKINPYEKNKQAQYVYWQETANRKATCFMSGVNVDRWMLRSPVTDQYCGVRCVMKDTGRAYSNSMTAGSGFIPCFCIG